MSKNIGNIDRILRLVVAAVFAILFFTGVVSGTVGYILLALAVIFTITSAISFCPIYAMVKFSTNK